jgi:pyrimidine operon attenuation protein/uracil phosphoribosyltransferase
MGQTKLDASDVRRTLGRMAHEVLEHNQGAEGLVVVGVLKSGFPVAKRLAFAMTQIEGSTIPCGSLDIRRFRDDRPDLADAPDDSEIPFAVAGKTVILVDEVIQTGRTIRAALDALISHGRPQKVQLAALIDRGGRELPIEPNYIGRKLEVAPDEYIHVSVGTETDYAVLVTKGEAACTS